MGGGGGVKPAPLPPPPPSETDPDVQAKRAARRYKAGLEQGFSSTIATNPLGSSGSAQQNGTSVSKLGG